MTDNTVTPQMLDIAEQMFSEATESHVTAEENLAAIKTDFTKLAGGKFRDGKIIVEVERLVVDALWQRVNSRAGRRTQSILRDLVSGQLSAVEVDHELDLVIVIGKHRRCTKLKHLNRADIRRLLEVRRKNAEEAQQAYEELRDICTTLDGVIVTHGGVPEAIDAGEFRLADPGEATA